MNILKFSLERYHSAVELQFYPVYVGCTLEECQLTIQMKNSRIIIERAVKKMAMGFPYPGLAVYDIHTVVFSNIPYSLM